MFWKIEVEVVGSEIQGHPQLNAKLQAYMDTRDYVKNDIKWRKRKLGTCTRDTLQKIEATMPK